MRRWVCHRYVIRVDLYLFVPETHLCIGWELRRVSWRNFRITRAKMPWFLRNSGLCDHGKMSTNLWKVGQDENKNMAGTKWVAVRNIPQENLLGEKIGFFTRPILIYPCGAKYLTQRSRPPGRRHDRKWVKCGLWAQKKRLPQDIPHSLVNGLMSSIRRQIGVIRLLPYKYNHINSTLRTEIMFKVTIVLDSFIEIRY